MAFLEYLRDTEKELLNLNQTQISDYQQHTKTIEKCEFFIRKRHFGRKIAKS